MLDLLTGVDPIASWSFALALLFVVTIVVWILLRLVTATAGNIDTTAAEIWQRGQLVANNTVHIAKAYEIKAGVDAILGRAASIAGSASAIKAHAESCPGCPACMLAGK
jgi:hypothetical protein